MSCTTTTTLSFGGCPGGVTVRQGSGRGPATTRSVLRCRGRPPPKVRAGRPVDSPDDLRRGSLGAGMCRRRRAVGVPVRLTRMRREPSVRGCYLVQASAQTCIDVGTHLISAQGCRLTSATRSPAGRRRIRVGSLTPSRPGTRWPHALRMRPSACSARRAGLRIASATDVGRNRRTDRHAEVATRSNPVGVDDCAVLIDRSPQWSQAVPARGGW
jgi:hypothetical protein